MFCFSVLGGFPSCFVVKRCSCFFLPGFLCTIYCYPTFLPFGCCYITIWDCQTCCFSFSSLQCYRTCAFASVSPSGIWSSSFLLDLGFVYFQLSFGWVYHSLILQLSCLYIISLVLSLLFPMFRSLSCVSENSLSLYIYMYVYMYIYLYVYIFIYLYVYIFIYLYIYIFIYLYTYIFIYLYIYIFIYLYIR